MLVTWHQKNTADRRSEWPRISWCLERTLSADDTDAELGWTLFGAVAATSFIASTDREVQRVVAARAAADDMAETVTRDDNETTARRD